MKKFAQIFLILVLSVMLLTGAFAGGFIAGHTTQLSSLGTLPLFQSPYLQPLQQYFQPQVSAKAPDTSLDSLFAPFWEAWNLVHKQYVDQPVDDTKLMRGAISGMLGAIGDPHTSYLDPASFKQLNTQLSGAYEGIGAYVDVTGEYLVVISPMPGSPAEKAGLKANDTIIKVDGEDMTGIDGNLVLKRVLGPAGSTVTLTIQRKGQESSLLSIFLLHFFNVPNNSSRHFFFSLPLFILN